MFRKVVSKSLLAVTIVGGLVAAPMLFAMDAGIKATIPFQFTVGKKMLPAGSYEFKVDENAGTVEVQNTNGKTGEDAMELYLTEIAPAMHNGGDKGHVVFDKVGTHYVLSEVWEHNGTDGILVTATKGKHDHEVIHVK